MLKLLFDSSPQGVLVTHDGEIVYSNSTIGKAAGFKPEHAVGQNISQLADILSPEDRESAIARFIALSSGKKESDKERFQYLDEQGRKRFAEITASTINLNKKNYVIIYSVDVTGDELSKNALPGSVADMIGSS